MITGFHALVYSEDAHATRAFFRDVLEWPHVDSGGGWLIFKTPPAELGVHPTGPGPGEGDPGEVWGTVPTHQVSLMCDDIHVTVADLKARGVEFDGDVVDEGFGLVAMLRVPGAGLFQLYEPRHERAHSLPDL